jgi:hypothetical protein
VNLSYVGSWEKVRWVDVVVATANCSIGQSIWDVGLDLSKYLNAICGTVDAGEIQENARWRR